MNTQPNLFDPDINPLARSTDPDTSHDAAKHIKQREHNSTGINPNSQCAALLAALHTLRRGADFQLAQHATHNGRTLYRAHVCYWHRVTDLITHGYATDTGERIINPDTGKARRIVAITPKGDQTHRTLTQ